MKSPLLDGKLVVALDRGICTVCAFKAEESNTQQTGQRVATPLLCGKLVDAGIEGLYRRPAVGIWA